MGTTKLKHEELDEIKILFDADPKNLDDEGTQGCGNGKPCPDFALHEPTNTIKLIDKAHSVVDMPIQTFNDLVQRMRSGAIKKLGTLLRGDENYSVGDLRFTADTATNRVVVTGAGGNQASMAVKHFNRFVEAARSGELKELAPLRRKQPT